MRGEIIKEAEELLGFKSGTTEPSPIAGGFTGAQKFVLQGHETDGTPGVVFVKAADLATNPDEAVVLETEAAMYKIISGLDSVSKYFPGYKGYKRDDHLVALFIDYLPELSWGGPWTTATVGMLASALDEIHGTTIDPPTGQAITERADSLRAKLYAQSPYTFDRPKRRQLFEAATDLRTGEFSNSRNQTYYQLPAEAANNLAVAATTFNPNSEKKFLVTDLNFGNIGFSPQQAYFVDPVYIELGGAATDMINVGINILRAVESTAANAQLIDQVKATFLADHAALADAITYWVACTALGYRGEDDAWMDYQQSCAVTALVTWEQLTSRADN
jgi:hypothetical protein